MKKKKKKRQEVQGQNLALASGKSYQRIPFLLGRTRRRPDDPNGR